MQLSRLFEQVYLLLDRKGMTADELAEHFEVSRRTIYRDVDTLAQAGIQLYGGVTGSADQAVADLLAGKLVFLPDVLCTHHGEGHGEGHSCGSHGCGGHCHE